MGVARERVHYDRWLATVSTAGYQTVRTYTLQPDSVSRLDFTFIANQSDENARAMFRRCALFFRKDSGVVQLQDPTWQTLETVKSDPNFDVKFLIMGTSVAIQVKNAGAGTVSTQWSGYTDRLDIVL